MRKLYQSDIDLGMSLTHVVSKRNVVQVLHSLSYIGSKVRESGIWKERERNRKQEYTEKKSGKGKEEGERRERAQENREGWSFWRENRRQETYWEPEANGTQTFKKSQHENRGTRRKKDGKGKEEEDEKAKWMRRDKDARSREPTAVYLL